MSLEYDLEIVDYPYPERLNTVQIASNNTGHSFLRPVIHGIPKKLRDNSNGISECLSAIDDHFQYLASAIGGQVVNHRWVLTKDTAIRSKIGSRAHSKGLVLFDRPNIWLGAIVDWVPGSQITEMNGFNKDVINEAKIALRDAAVNWKEQEGWSTLPGELTDLYQFLSSSNPSNATVRNLSPTLIDIDIIQ